MSGIIKYVIIVVIIICVGLLFVWLNKGSNGIEEDLGLSETDSITIVSQEQLNEQLEYLQNHISENSNLDEIVDTFEQMCKDPIDEELVFYETGIFDFTGENLFYFSITRQFPNGEDEYYQVHVDVMYNPDKESRRFSDEVWCDEINENFFDYLRKTPEYLYAKDVKCKKIEIYVDET